MANVHLTANSAVLSHRNGSAVSLVDRIGGLFSKFVALRALYKAERELKSLDDRMLSDIGIERADIHNRVWFGR